MIHDQVIGQVHLGLAIDTDAHGASAKDTTLAAIRCQRAGTEVIEMYDVRAHAAAGIAPPRPDRRLRTSLSQSSNRDIRRSQSHESLFALSAKKSRRYPRPDAKQ